MLVVRHISRKMSLISRERGMCSGNSEREDRNEGKGGVLEKGPETIKSDFQSSVNVYDFQGANYWAKSEGRSARGRFPATEIDHITLRLIKFKRC